ncbi:GMC family oxidoreductase [Sulfuriferula nivalis]|nr:GMC oxidoreductase [Sulfuriferula nivalis]
MTNIKEDKMTDSGKRADRVYDYIVVGAGPGGGPLAANLAKAGFTVALLEAGLDPLSLEAAAQDPNAKAAYEVPGFFGASAENPLLSWEIYVSHYANVEQQRKDKKYVEGKGVLYPRGSCLGGSVSHNALIWVYPHDGDFDAIARTTDDVSWAAEKMRGYYERIENCQYCGPAQEGHGFAGYIPTSMNEEEGYAAAIPQHTDIATAGVETPPEVVKINPTLDVNHPSVAKGATGYFHTPMHMLNKKRVGIREYLVAVQSAHPDKLDIITNALATQVMFEKEGGALRAVGIEYMHGGGQSYKAHKLSKDASRGEKRVLFARREVILSGGAFNTPQLLKLSGIGPKEELRQLGIDVRVDLPGVGANLQDRYEVPVVLKLKGGDTNPLWGRCTFQGGDPAMQSYESGRWIDDKGVEHAFSGPYAGNNLSGTRIAKSSYAKGDPDLFFVGLPVAFYGYFPGFSTQQATNHFSWNVLKAHTENTAGTVTLRSADPADVPEIIFRFFEEGNAGDADMKATIEGVRMIRRAMAEPAAQQHIEEETAPGSNVTSQADLEEFARNTARGHHASCTAKIGAVDDPMAVLDSRFRVRGVNGLRVVDACVFPKTPGFFPTAAIIMISEKASDVILEDARRNG